MENKSAIYLLFLANTISGFSQGISMIAIPWYFTVVLGLQMPFGIFYGILTIGSTIWSIYAGTLIDKYDRKKILIVQSILGCLVLTSAAIIGRYTNTPIWVVSGVVFAFTVFIYNIHYMNIYSFAQEITPKEYYSKVISYLEIQGQSTTIIGGALAALLIEGTQNREFNLFGFQVQLPLDIKSWDLYEIFCLDALTYFIAIFILMAIRYVPIAERVLEKESVWKRILIGWNFIKDKPALMVFGWLTPSVFICVMLTSYFLMPSYVSHFLHQKSHVFASSEFYFALGALIAGIGAQYFMKSMHEVNRILILFFLGAIVFAIFSLNRNLGIFYFANILFGFSNASIRFNRVSYIWKIVPNEIAGRVSSVINISSYLFRAIWGFIFSFSIFKGEKGIQLVMMVLLFFIALSGTVIGIYRQKIKHLELT